MNCGIESKTKTIALVEAKKEAPSLWRWGDERVVVVFTYCTFDPNWQPGPWISRISCSSQLDYCRAGQKKKSYLGHGSAMIIGQDFLVVDY